MQRFRGGLVFKALRLCKSPNPSLENNREEEETWGGGCALLGTVLQAPRVGGARQETRRQRTECAAMEHTDTDMCSGSKAGSYLRFINFVVHSALG